MAAVDWLTRILQANQAAQSSIGTGGVEAPPEVAAGPEAAAQDPMQAFLANALKYGKADPLAARARQGLSMGGAAGQQPVSLVRNEAGAGALGKVAGVASHGPREGHAHNTFDLGNGMKANVYYDAAGKRKVYVYSAAPAAG